MTPSEHEQDQDPRREHTPSPTNHPSPTASWHPDSESPSELRDRETEPLPSAGQTSKSLSLELPLTLGRYHLLEEMDRGGMGAILRGLDDHFDRPLAFKVLLDQYHQHPQAVRRFETEARIMGRLQHPGIAPVHEQGILPDGRPFFSMKLIQGKTLESLLRERTSVREDLPHLLAIFEQTCQTLAYAHAQGIIHRDLKPSNIMVGEFGEVQVMDWGLAKVLGQSESEERDSTPQDSQISGEDATQMGSILGTPAYLAPEQARGAIDEIDQRCDVFGLGAILLEILTGHPPYGGRATKETRAQAATGDLTPAFRRLDESGADPQLLALAKRCLAAKREERFSDALAVAHQIGQYQQLVQVRLQQMQIERGQAEIKAEEERKRRRITFILFATLLMMLLGLGGGLLWYQKHLAEKETQQAREQQKTEREWEKQRQLVQSTLDRVLNLIADARWEQARDRLAQTQKQLGESAELELREKLRRAELDLELAKKVNEHLFVHSQVVQAVGERPTLSRQYQDLFETAGLGTPTDSEEVIADRIRNSQIRSTWIAALDDWSQTGNVDEQKRILKIARLADPNDLHNRFRDPVLLADYHRLLKEMKGTSAEKMSPSLWAVLCMRLQNAEDEDHKLIQNESGAVAMWRAGQRAAPTDFWLNYLLGNALYGSSPREAIEFYRAAYALRPQYFGVLLNLGALLEARGDYDEAMQLYVQALDVRPNHPGVYQNLGLIHVAREEWDQALEALDAALSVNPKLSRTWASLGLVWYHKKNFDKAIEACENAIRFGPRTLSGRVNLAMVYKEQNRVDDVIRLSQETLVLAANHYRALQLLGWAYVSKREFASALTVYQKMVRNHPQDVKAWLRVGELCLVVKRYEEGIKWLRHGTRLHPREAALYAVLGQLQLEAREFSQALVSLRNAQKLRGEDTQSGAYLLTQRHIRLCEQALQIEQRLQAVLEGRAKPRDVDELLTLGRFCVLDRPRYLRSVRFYEEAFRLNPKLMESPEKLHRMWAAQAAILAGTDSDVESLPEDERAKLRKQARDWLGADLKIWTERAKQPQNHETIAQLLQIWLTTPKMADVRDEKALSQLSEEERKEWNAFWKRCRDLLTRVRKADS